MRNFKSRNLAEIFPKIEEFERILELAESNADKGFEEDFCLSIRERYDRYGFQMIFSEKQETVLDKIAYKDK